MKKCKHNRNVIKGLKFKIEMLLLLEIIDVTFHLLDIASNANVYII